MKNKDFSNMIDFLTEITQNNTRPWFQENREWYDQSRAYFEDIVNSLLIRIRQFDESIGHLRVKDCTYRFYRDTRFSPDKAPYKRHFGAYICAKGRKALHGGYYLHIDPNGCFLACGTWYLPSNILKEVRMSIVEDLGSFRDIVEAPEFKAVYTNVGFDPLKTIPRGFPADFSHLEYIRPKVYSCFTELPFEFFDQPDFLDQIAHRCQIGKPFIDFINDTIDDYAEA